MQVRGIEEVSIVELGGPVCSGAASAAADADCGIDEDVEDAVFKARGSKLETWTIVE